MTRTLSISLALAAALLGGCIEGELDRKSIVDRWRVLAIQASAPEARPGMDVSFEPLVVRPDGRHAVHGEDGVTFGWVACIRPEGAPGLGGLQYDPEDPSEACAAADLAFDLETLPGGGARIAGGTTAFLWPDPGTLTEGARAVFGDDITPELIETFLSTVGIMVVVQLTIQLDDEQVHRAYKRFTLVDREDLGENPPPPRLQVGATWVTGRGVPEPWTCLPEDGATPAFAPGQAVILSPDPDDDHWRDTYWVLDITGTLTEVLERPYYAFLSTGGSFDQEVTRAPVREEIWRVPEEPGTHPLWLVVRDGHGGMSACRAEVEVR